MPPLPVVLLLCLLCRSPFSSIASCPSTVQGVVFAFIVLQPCFSCTHSLVYFLIVSNRLGRSPWFLVAHLWVVDASLLAGLGQRTASLLASLKETSKMSAFNTTLDDLSCCTPPISWHPLYPLLNHDEPLLPFWRPPWPVLHSYAQPFQPQAPGASPPAGSTEQSKCGIEWTVNQECNVEREMFSKT